MVTGNGSPCRAARTLAALVPGYGRDCAYSPLQTARVTRRGAGRVCAPISACQGAVAGCAPEAAQTAGAATMHGAQQHE